MSQDGRFPRTRHSVVLATHHGDAGARHAAWDALVRAYWKPVYKHLRLAWHRSPDAAEDGTQEFFARAMEKEFFAGFDPQRARFRTFLRVCLDRFAHDEATAARRHKRGGGRAPLPLDFAGAEHELAAGGPTPPEELEAAFQREWTKSLFEQALADLGAAARASGCDAWFRAFCRYDLEARERGEALTYQDLAREFAVPVTQVTNWLHTARSRLRQHLLTRLAELCADDAEFRDEARLLLGDA
ncbi:MAG: sigma-70 family RNA polymerase sigma factor [Planctomycetota bacterium]